MAGDELVRALGRARKGLRDSREPPQGGQPAQKRREGRSRRVAAAVLVDQVPGRVALVRGEVAEQLLAGLGADRGEVEAVAAGERADPADRAPAEPAVLVVEDGGAHRARRSSSASTRAGSRPRAASRTYE